MIVINLLLLLIPVSIVCAVIMGLKTHPLRRAQRERDRQVRKASRAVERARHQAERDAYVDSLRFPSFYQLVIIFTVASIGGLVLETVWVRFAMGVWQHRYGMVWGPFSPLYGVGAVLLTACLWKLRKRPVWVIFLVSMLLGTALEQATGMLIDGVLHATSWSYSHLPDAITKYVSLHMSVFWGLLGWAWCRVCLPEALWLIGEPKRRGELVLVAVLTAFLVLDGLMTVAVTMRKAARDAGVPAANVIEQHIDEYYDDRFVSERFENLEFDNSFEEERDSAAEPGITRHDLPVTVGADISARADEDGRTGSEDAGGDEANASVADSASQERAA